MYSNTLGLPGLAENFSMVSGCSWGACWYLAGIQHSLGKSELGAYGQLSICTGMSVQLYVYPPADWDLHQTCRQISQISASGKYVGNACNWSALANRCVFILRSLTSSIQKVFVKLCAQDTGT